MDIQQQNEQPNQELTVATPSPDVPTIQAPGYQPPISTTTVAESDKSNVPLIIALIIVVISMLLFIVGAFIINPYLVKNRESAAKAAESKFYTETDDTFANYGTSDNTPGNYGPTTDEKNEAEKAIRDYFTLLNQKKFTEAVDSMSHNTINNEATRQKWISGLSNLLSIKIETLEELGPEMWANSTPQYSIVFKATYGPVKTTSPIFNEGKNTRYIFVNNEDGIKKVHSFQTNTDPIY